MHDMLFTNQKTWHASFDARPIFDDYAVKIGLDLEKFNRDVAGSVGEQRIFLDGKRAHALGVSGTPTVFMNGREIPFESLAPERLRPIIQAELDARR
jgi:protein-disulfide isomerase